MTAQVMPVIGNIPDLFENTLNLYEGDLVWYFPIIASAPNINAPYHNLRHMLHTTMLCYDALLFHKKSGSELPLGRPLLKGGLFHDYGHLAGKAKTDDENIEIAVVGLYTHIHDNDLINVGNIEGWMRSTLYPHRGPARNVYEAILRDADKAQAFSSAWIQQIGVGLAEEMGISMREMLEKQVTFLRNLKFESAWGRFTFEKHIPAKIEETQRVLRLL
ncbi:MAG: hypothetical protein V4690_02090 [Patescibacteria group bacterium]